MNNKFFIMVVNVWTKINIVVNSFLDGSNSYCFYTKYQSVLDDIVFWFYQSGI